MAGGVRRAGTAPTLVRPLTLTCRPAHGSLMLMGLRLCSSGSRAVQGGRAFRGLPADAHRCSASPRRSTCAPPQLPSWFGSMGSMGSIGSMGSMGSMGSGGRAG